MVDTGMRVLVTDDEPDAADWLRRHLEQRGLSVRVAGDVRTAELYCEVWRPDLLLLDLGLPDGDGLTVLRRVRSQPSPPEVIVVTGRATVRDAVDALTAGASNLLEKPLDLDRLDPLLDRALETRRHDEELERRRDDVAPLEEVGGLISSDPRMHRVFAMLRTAAPTLANVLIEGESGTGKELVASAIHELSPRAQGPFIKLNCAAIPPELLESELFGHSRGAFTGAIAARKGLFELAHHGSILLDEIGEMPIPLQVKLLRVLQDREFRPVGSNATVRADFRLICATNIDARRAVHEGRLRPDLYFRLNTIVLHLPPLRERVGDVRLLASRLLERFAARDRPSLRGFDETALQCLERHPWPGNVRELEHVVERAVILARGTEVRIDDLPESLRAVERARTGQMTVPSGCTLAEVERAAILQTLELTSWNKWAAARILGIQRPTLYNKLRKYGLWRREDRFRHDDGREPIN